MSQRRVPPRFRSTVSKFLYKLISLLSTARNSSFGGARTDLQPRRPVESIMLAVKAMEAIEECPGYVFLYQQPKHLTQLPSPCKAFPSLHPMFSVAFLFVHIHRVCWTTMDPIWFVHICTFSSWPLQAVPASALQRLKYLFPTISLCYLLQHNRSKQKYGVSIHVMIIRFER